MKKLLLAAILFLGAAPILPQGMGGKAGMGGKTGIGGGLIGFAAFDVGFDHRDTLAYVSDASCCVFVKGTNSAQTAYPTTTTVNGSSTTYGWETNTANQDSRDRNNTYDPRIAGIVFQPNTGLQSTFRVDLPATGVYSLQIVTGDQGGGNAGSNYLVVNDTNTTRYTLTGSPCASDSTHFTDATCTQFAGPSYQGSPGTTGNLTFTTTILRIVIGSVANTSGNTFLAHLRITRIS